MTDWDLEPCICSEGKARRITKSQARAFNFCGNCADGFCSMWFVCHDDKSKPVKPLKWFCAAIRIHYDWRIYDILAYSKEQAIKLLRDKVGYDRRLGHNDFEIKVHRELTREQTLQNRNCRIRERVN